MCLENYEGATFLFYRKEAYLPLTLLVRIPDALVVCLAYQAAVVAEVELVARVERLAADDTDEALHVVDVLVRPPNHVARGDNLATARATRSEQSETEKTVEFEG